MIKSEKKNKSTAITHFIPCLLVNERRDLLNDGVERKHS